MEDFNQVADGTLRRHSRNAHGLQPFRDNGRLRMLKLWLNIIFMLGAATGMVLWFTNYRDVATYVLIGSIIPKFLEVTLRILKL